MELVQALLSKGREVVPPLSRILEDRQYWEAPDERGWMPVHAVKLLGTLADPQALPSLVRALVLADETDYDWVMEDLPTVFGRIGPPAVEPLMAFILRYRGDEKFCYARSMAAEGLAAIAPNHPEERERVLSFLHGLFSEGEDPEFLGFVAGHLVDLADPSSLPILEGAFTRGLIAEGIIDREYVQKSWKKGERTLAASRRDLLDFYDPQQIAERQARWEEGRREEERRTAQRLEEREQAIARELRRLEVALKWERPEILPSLRKAGRNDPCPCGSGKKFKKCCLVFIEGLPPKQVLGAGRYATRPYLEQAPPYDPALVLENLTALAMQAEKDGDVTRALEIFRRLEPLAERRGMLGNLLHEWETMCYNHPELGEEGLNIIRRLQAFSQGKDREGWAYARMDAADYLSRLGRWEEGQKEYEDLLREMSDFPFAHIRFARFLEQGGRMGEALHHYRQVLQMEAQAGRDALEMAAEELKELAFRQGLPLDAWTQEAIERWSRRDEAEATPE